MKHQSQESRQTHHTTFVKHHRNRNIILTIAAVGILSMVVMAVYSLANSGVKPGQAAPDFTAQDINNNSFHLYAHRGTPMLIEFMRTSCSHCQNEAPTLTSLYSNHQNQMVFVSISTDSTGDTPMVMAQWMQHYSQSWTFIRDTSGLTGTYGVSGTPTIFLLDKNCMIKYSWVGETSQQTLENAVQSLM